MDVMETIPLRFEILEKLKGDDPIAKVYIFSLFKSALFFMSPNAQAMYGEKAKEIFDKYLELFYKIYGKNTEDIQQLFKQKRYGQLVDLFNNGKIDQTQYPEIYKHLEQLIEDTASIINDSYIPLRDISNKARTESLTTHMGKIDKETVIHVLEQIRTSEDIMKEGFDIINKIVQTCEDPNLLFYVLKIVFGEDPAGVNKALKFFEHMDYIVSELVALDYMFKQEWKPVIKEIIDEELNTASTLIHNPGENKTEVAIQCRELISLLESYKNALEKTNLFDKDYINRIDNVLVELREKLNVYDEEGRQQRIRAYEVPEDKYNGEDKSGLVEKAIKDFENKWPKLKGKVLGVIFPDESWKEVKETIIKYDKYRDAIIAVDEHYRYMVVYYVVDLGKHDDELWLYGATIREDKNENGWSEVYLWGEMGGNPALKENVIKNLKH